MSLNGVGFTESIVHAQAQNYRYRSGMGMIPSAEFSVFMDDFVGPVASNVPDGWKAAVISLGATVVADTTAALGATGTLLIGSDGITEGAAFYGSKSVQLTSGKRFFMELRFQTELAADSDVQFGLTDLTATANPEDLWTTAAANLVAFGVLAGSATVTMLADAANSGSTVETGTKDLSNATWHTLAIYYDGANLSGFVDGTLALVWAQAVVPVGVALAPFVGFRTGSSATTKGRADFVRYVLER